MRPSLILAVVLLPAALAAQPSQGSYLAGGSLGAGAMFCDDCPESSFAIAPVLHLGYQLGPETAIGAVAQAGFDNDFLQVLAGGFYRFILHPRVWVEGQAGIAVFDVDVGSGDFGVSLGGAAGYRLWTGQSLTISAELFGGVGAYDTSTFLGQIAGGIGVELFTQGAPQEL